MDFSRLEKAYQKACGDLLAERADSGVWVGRLSDSALSTATAISALAMVDRMRMSHESQESDKVPQFQEVIQGALERLVSWQNPDGGWGDTDRSFSNLATTMLVRAAFALAEGTYSPEIADKYAEPLCQAEAYIEREGGIPGLRRRFGKDKTFAVPILTNGALAGLVDWAEVSPLPFELACLPFNRLKWLKLPVVSYAIPALVAIGQASYFHRKPKNPLLRWIRRKAVEPSLRVLQRMQPDSGGFLEATPLTSFVVMSLASTGEVDHPVVRRGVEFLCRSMRENHAWPIDENLSTWVTTLSINALFGSKSGFKKVSHLACEVANEGTGQTILRALLDRQQIAVHPFTDAEPGGWGWTGLSGAVPDVDDTAGALLALYTLRKKGIEEGWLAESDELDRRTIRAALAGVDWLLSVQNRDGGWPTFCRGWGTMPFDRSSTDLTAHVLRALTRWLPLAFQETQSGKKLEQIARARYYGFAFLGKVQGKDGSWTPLWFGNQYHANEANPIFGTARVLLAYRDQGENSSPVAQRAGAWLAEQQNSDGGWGGNLVDRSSVEETAAVLSSLLGGWTQADYADRIEQGLNWLIAAVESDAYRHASPIGLYFSRLWYYERLYPLIFTVDALRRAMEV